MSSRPARGARRYRPAGSLSLAAVAATLLVLAVGCGGDDPADPATPSGPISLPTLYTFESGLEGWTLGARSGATASRLASAGLVVLQGSGTLGEPDAWMSREVSLPDVEFLWIDVRAFNCDAVDAVDGDANIRILATPVGGTPILIKDWEHLDGDGDVVDASLEAVAGQTVTLRIEQDDDGDPSGPDTACVDEVEIFID